VLLLGRTCVLISVLTHEFVSCSTEVCSFPPLNISTPVQSCLTVYPCVSRPCMPPSPQFPHNRTAFAHHA